MPHVACPSVRSCCDEHEPSGLGTMERNVEHSANVFSIMIREGVISYCLQKQVLTTLKIMLSETSNYFDFRLEENCIRTFLQKLGK